MNPQKSDPQVSETQSKHNHITAHSCYYGHEHQAYKRNLINRYEQTKTNENNKKTSQKPQ